MQTTNYNGWTNYETWNVKLWIDNDEGSQGYWSERADDCLKTDGAEDGITSLADILKEEHQDRAAELLPDAGVFTDLLGAALSEVNWYEIAQSMITDAKERVES